MAVILTTPEEVQLWLMADPAKALELQRPLPDRALKIVASGERKIKREIERPEHARLLAQPLGPGVRSPCGLGKRPRSAFAVILGRSHRVTRRKTVPRERLAFRVTMQ
jgi:hypothetical protein